MSSAKETLRELQLGIGLWGVLVLLAGMFCLRNDRLAYGAGAIAGVLTALYLSWNMYHHLDIALSEDKQFAKKHVQIWAVMRLIVMALVVGMSMVFYTYVHPIGVVLGIWGLKIAAWTQPMIHKYRTLLAARFTKDTSEK